MRNRTRWLVFLTVVLALLFSGVKIPKTVWWQHVWHASGPGRQELLVMYDALTPGWAKSHVMATWQQLNPKYLTIRESAGDSCYFVNTPDSVFHRDWLLIIEIDGGKIHEIRVRTRESVDIHPEEAPPDKRKLLSVPTTAVSVFT